MNELSSNEQARYQRHFSLAEIGSSGQVKIKNSKVLCVGAGGLGSTVLYYLAAAGVGTIGIIDGDRVELSNLQRQILYTTVDIGQSKAEQAQKRLQALNPECTIYSYPTRLSVDNAFELIAQYDLVVDATDNFETRYLVNDVCCHLKKPDIFAGILRFQGQCSVFGLENGPCYRCFYPAPPPPHLAPNCSEAGVVGVLPGIMGCMQAMEALKLIVSMGKPLSGRVLNFDALNSQWTDYQLPIHPQCPICSEHKSFKELERFLTSCAKAPEISVDDFNHLKKQNAEFILLDVREPEEYAEHHLNGYLIPLKQLPQRMDELKKNSLIIVYCKSGARSNQAALLLLAKGFTHVQSLRGGILAVEEHEQLKRQA
jgi:molybdopterin/thiamine biosynthesis adenylyltransferase/rhodanese-related sulfurtransferase